VPEEGDATLPARQARDFALDSGLNLSAVTRCRFASRHRDGMRSDFWVATPTVSAAPDLQRSQRHIGNAFVVFSARHVLAMQRDHGRWWAKISRKKIRDAPSNLPALASHRLRELGRGTRIPPAHQEIAATQRRHGTADG
jgi:hypothetical protein